MASQSQGIQQLLQAEKRAAEKVSEARKREFRGGAAGRGARPRSAARPREVAGSEARNTAGRRVVPIAEAARPEGLDLRLWKAWGATGSCLVG